MVRYLLPAAVAAVIVIQGIVHGLWSGRWGADDELNRAAARLDRIPTVIGDWRGKTAQLGEKEVEMAGYTNYVLRRYESPGGHTFSVLIGCGRPGPLSLHAPDVCYRAAGYQPSGSPSQRSVAGGKKFPGAVFYEGTFSKPDGSGAPPLRILWAWKAGAAWEAPDNPRLTFAGSRALYKVYVIQPRTLGDGRREDALLKQFLSQLLPELHKALSFKE